MEGKDTDNHDECKCKKIKPGHPGPGLVIPVDTSNSLIDDE